MRVRALGSNPVALQRAGLRPLTARVIAYAAAGALGVLAGLVLASQTGGGDISSAASYTLITVAAVILGGGSFAGGTAVPWGVAIGGVTLGLVTVSSACSTCRRTCSRPCRAASCWPCSPAASWSERFSDDPRTLDPPLDLGLPSPPRWSGPLILAISDSGGGQTGLPGPVPRALPGHRRPGPDARRSPPGPATSTSRWRHHLPRRRTSRCRRRIHRPVAGRARPASAPASSPARCQRRGHPRAVGTADHRHARRGLIARRLTLSLADGCTAGARRRAARLLNARPAGVPVIAVAVAALTGGHRADARPHPATDGPLLAIGQSGRPQSARGSRSARVIATAYLASGALAGLAGALLAAYIAPSRTSAPATCSTRWPSSSSAGHSSPAGGPCPSGHLGQRALLRPADRPGQPRGLERGAQNLLKGVLVLAVLYLWPAAGRRDAGRVASARGGCATALQPRKDDRKHQWLTRRPARRPDFGGDRDWRQRLPRQGRPRPGLGAASRLSRIFDPDNGRTVMLAFDHGYFRGPQRGWSGSTATSSRSCRTPTR